MAQDGLILTEAQLVAMEKKREQQEAIGEIETEHPVTLEPRTRIMWAISRV